jgi:hypothetical protein
MDLRDLFSSLQDEMHSKLKQSEVLNHSVDKGDNSEFNWIELLSNYLPQRYQVAKATIIDSKGNISEQIDLVIYDGQYSYLAFNQAGIKYIPAESIYAVFEVKQDLSKDHLEYAAKKAASVRNLFRTSAPIPHAGGVFKPKPLQPIIAGILTTRNSWATGYGKPFKDCIKTLNDAYQIDCGCVLEEGSFIYDSDSKQLCTGKKEEALVSFILQLVKQLQAVGTVPAIELDAYMNVLAFTKEAVV